MPQTVEHEVSRRVASRRAVIVSLSCRQSRAGPGAGPRAGPGAGPRAGPRGLIEALLFGQITVRNRYPIGRLQQCSAAELHHGPASSTTHRTANPQQRRSSSSSSGSSGGSSGSNTPGLMPRRAVVVPQIPRQFQQPSSHSCCRLTNRNLNYNHGSRLVGQIHARGRRL